MFAGICVLMALQFLPENLMIAARSGETRGVAILLHAGIEPDARHELTGWTPLSAASFYGHVDVVRLLLEAGADPDATDKRGGTSLMKTIAIPGGEREELIAQKVEILKLLLNAGADPQKTDALGGKAWQTAIIRNQQKFVKVFADARVRGVRETQLLEAIAIGDATAVRELISSGADVNYRDEGGWTALSEAALAGDPLILTMVIDADADVNFRFGRDWTALMIAAHQNHSECVGVLLAAGADRTARNAEGLTALDLALAIGNADSANLLQQR